jgi:peptidoglycan/LPS O-acetylase OafA/YrhL
MNTRIQYVDGLRGIAIIFVVLFHAYSRWGVAEPFTQNEILTSAFAYGFLGVQLFFAISGYVIYMSVLRSDNFIMFGTARYLRLAPAMLFASILIYISSFLIPERPSGIINLVDFLPSLTFIDPPLLSILTGLDIKSMDGVFWSLYVEVKFYFIVAVAFFLLKDKKLFLILLLYVAWLLLTAFKYFHFESYVSIELLRVLNIVGIDFYGWFLMGIYAFRYETKKTKRNLVLLILISLLAVLTTETGNLQMTLAATFFALLFLIPIFIVSVRNILSSKLLVFFGFISYPLYLIHQNTVTGLAIKLHTILPNLPSYLYPIPFLMLVILIAYILAKLEPSLKLVFKRFIPSKVYGIEVFKRK